MNFKASYLLIFLPVIVILQSFALHRDINKIEDAIKGGNSSQLSSYFQKTIMLDMPGHSGSYSKQQASYIMSDFFKEHKAKSFSFSQQISSNNNTKNLLGRYTTKKNKTFIVKVVVVTDGENTSIKEIQFK